MTTSVVIRAYNEERHIGRLLSGLEQQDEPVDEVVLVDSGSTDATVEIAKAFRVKVVSIPKSEFTFGRSLNLGIDAVRGEKVVILSAHVYPLYRSFTHEITAPFDREDVGMVYGRQVGDERIKLAEERMLRRWFPSSGAGPHAEPFANNANSCVRRSLWKEHPFDESLTGLEDIGFAMEVQNLDMKVWYSPEAVVVHVHEESWSQVRNRYFREALARKRLFPTQRLSKRQLLQMAVMNMAGDSLEALQTHRSPRIAAQSIRFRYEQFLGAHLAEKAFNESVDERALIRRLYYPPSVALSVDPSAHDGAPIQYG